MILFNFKNKIYKSFYKLYAIFFCSYCNSKETKLFDSLRLFIDSIFL